MDVVQLQRHYIDYTSSLHREGLLDDQFTQLQGLADDSNPGFAFEVVSLFFEDSESLLKDLTHEVEQPVMDFKQVAAHAHQFKGSSSSIGAVRVKNACVLFRNYCEEEDAEGCRRCLQQLKNDYVLLKSKLEMLFKEGRTVSFWCSSFLPDYVIRTLASRIEKLEHRGDFVRLNETSHGVQPNSQGDQTKTEWCFCPVMLRMRHRGLGQQILAAGGSLPSMD